MRIVVWTDKGGRGFSGKEAALILAAGALVTYSIKKLYEKIKNR